MGTLQGKLQSQEDDNPVGKRRAAFRDISWGWETYIAIICCRIGLRGCCEEGCYFHYIDPTDKRS
jgi:hypothetical protein